MRTLFGSLFIITALVLGYIGYNKLDESSNSVSFEQYELGATDTDMREQGYLMLGGGGILLIAGFILIGKSERSYHVLHASNPQENNTPAIPQRNYWPAILIISVVLILAVLLSPALAPFIYTLF